MTCSYRSGSAAKVQRLSYRDIAEKPALKMTDLDERQYVASLM